MFGNVQGNREACIESTAECSPASCLNYLLKDNSLESTSCGSTFSLSLSPFNCLSSDTPILREIWELNIRDKSCGSGNPLLPTNAQIKDACQGLEKSKKKKNKNKTKREKHWSAWKLQVTLKGPPRVPRALSQPRLMPRITDKEPAIKQLAQH